MARGHAGSSRDPRPTRRLRPADRPDPGARAAPQQTLVVRRPLRPGASRPWPPWSPRWWCGATRGGCCCSPRCSAWSPPRSGSSVTTSATSRSPGTPPGCGSSGSLDGNLMGGMSFGWWVTKHNAHHAHPNDLESDPDVRAGVLVFDAGPGGRPSRPRGLDDQAPGAPLLPVPARRGRQPPRRERPRAAHAGAAAPRRPRRH